MSWYMLLFVNEAETFYPILHLWVTWRHMFSSMFIKCWSNICQLMHGFFLFWGMVDFWSDMLKCFYNYAYRMHSEKVQIGVDNDMNEKNKLNQMLIFVEHGSWPEMFENYLNSCQRKLLEFLLWMAFRPLFVIL